MKISLKEFALTGAFGPVKIGMHKDEVIALLRKPDCDNDFSTCSSGLLYAWYEIFYWTENGEIYTIQNDHLQTYGGDNSDQILFKNDHVEIDTWFLKVDRDTTYQEVIHILEEEHIAFKRAKEYDSELIVFSSGVYFDFDGMEKVDKYDKNGDWYSYDEIEMEDKNKHILNGIRYFPELVFPPR